VLIALAYVATDPRMRAIVLERLWRIPSIGEKIKAYQLARMYRTLACCAARAFPSCAPSAWWRRLARRASARAARSSEKSIEEGVSLSAALTAAGLASARRTPNARRVG